MACFVCAAALFAVLHTHVQNGMTGLWNQTVEVLGSKAGIYLTQYTVSEENMGNDQFILWMLLALVTGLVAFAVLQTAAAFYYDSVEYGLSGVGFYAKYSTRPG